VCVAVTAVFGGCMQSAPRDGLNGKDLNIYDLYEAAKLASGNPDMTMSEFLKEYLSYTSSELEQAVSLQAAINRSLTSSVSITSEWNMTLTTEYSNGSGVIIDVDLEKGDMTVVTNCHVVYSAKATGDGYSDNIKLWLYGSESAYPVTNEKNAIEAEIVATSKSYDIAVLKVENSPKVRQSKATKALWSSGEERYQGETVYAIGNANGDKISSSVGYISRDREDIKVNLGTESNQQVYDYSVLRTSATINSGNSGGGLYNLDCELAGIVNAKHKDHDTVGYALPASTVKRVVNSMLSNYGGVETHGVKVVNHGISVMVTDSYSTGLNDKGFAEIYEEVSINSVGFAKPLGRLNRGDIIKHVKIVRPSENDRVVEDLDIMREHNFYDVMLSVAQGDTVEFTVMRGGVLSTVSIAFDEENDFKTED
ncbi:MAG: S1C family serine protease, partial [Clostridia bacterium]|nr:S1C family serine protease [Clostridia bacterium]